MRWRRVDRWHQQADDYHYRVAAFAYPGRMVYQAFFSKDRRTEILCTSESAAACRQAAEAHKRGDHHGN